MKKIEDSPSEVLWKEFGLDKLSNEIVSQYKEHGLASIKFEYKGENYLLKLTKVNPRKNKLK